MQNFLGVSPSFLVILTPQQWSRSSIMPHGVRRSQPFLCQPFHQHDCSFYPLLPPRLFMMSQGPIHCLLTAVTMTRSQLGCQFWVALDPASTVLPKPCGLLSLLVEAKESAEIPILLSLHPVGSTQVTVVQEGERDASTSVSNPDEGTPWQKWPGL